MSIIPGTPEGELLRRRARKDYATYCKLANPRFCMTHLHYYLCRKIQEFIEAPCTNGFMDILLLSLPPQHGKSFTVSETLPSWFEAKWPEKSTIIAGYESTFAEGFNRRNRDKFNTIGQEVFFQERSDGTIVHDCRPNASVQTVAIWETALGGRCRAVGLKGGITGYPADLFIIDDPIKNQQQAESDTVITTIHDEMGPSVQSRIHPNGKLIVIQTRWVENDVIGWIETHWSEFIWANINLPCEYDEEAAKLGPDPLGRKLGDSLIGAQVGDDESQIPLDILNNNRWLQSKKKLVLAGDGEHTWNALYQGRPFADTGDLFKREYWKTFSRTSAIRDNLDYLQMSIDATFRNTETSDYVAIEVWGLQGRDTYLFKLVNKRMGFRDTVQKIKDICREFNDIDELVIELKANGDAIVDTLMYEENMPPIVGVEPKGGKFARAQATSNYVSTGACHLPDDLTAEELADIESDNPKYVGIEAFIQQHAGFPFAKHDDMVDSQTQGLTRIIKLITGEVQMPKHKRRVRYRKWTRDMWEDYEQLNESDQELFIRLYGAPEEWAV